MDTVHFYSHCLSKREKILGTGYLLFETFFLALLLQLLNLLLPTPLPQTEINFLFFVINFFAVTHIFKDFLCAQLKLLPDAMEQVLFVSIPGFLVYWLMNALLAQLIFAMDPDFFNVNDIAVGKLVSENFPLMFISTVILAPITEECLFRGLLFRGLYDYRSALGWIVSVVLFSLVHILNYIGVYPISTLALCFLQYLPAGICLAGAYRLSGSILTPILIHATINFLSMMSLR